MLARLTAWPDSKRVLGLRYAVNSSARWSATASNSALVNASGSSRSNASTVGVKASSSKRRTASASQRAAFSRNFASTSGDSSRVIFIAEPLWYYGAKVPDKASCMPHLIRRMTPSPDTPHAGPFSLIQRRYPLYHRLLPEPGGSQSRGGEESGASCLPLPTATGCLAGGR